MEQPKQAEKSEVLWSEEDEKWSKSVPAALVPIAKRHGAKLFRIVWQAGTMSEGLGRMVEVSNQLARSLHHRPHAQAVMQFVSIGQNVTNALCTSALQGAGKTLEDFAECKEDIERMMALQATAQQGGERVSPGGIVLNG